MPRYRIQDTFELDDDDLEMPGSGDFLRRSRPRFPAHLFVLFALFVMGIAGLISAIYFDRQMASDDFCAGCHLPQHKTYLERGQSATNGTLAADLSSYHYQQIRGSSGSIRCIDCHRGDDSLSAHAETLLVSARYTVRWLAQQDDPTIEKGAISATLQISQADGTLATTVQWPNIAIEPGFEVAAALWTRVITYSNRVTTTVGLPRMLSPRLSNDGCVTCHQPTLLLAGQENHFHNTLPAAYTLWKNGAQLISPKGVVDPQIVRAEGLTYYQTNLQCAGCHQAHRQVDNGVFLDKTNVVVKGCVQCHREVGRGPLEIKLTDE